MPSMLVLLLAAASWQQAPAPPEPQLQPTIHAALPRNVDDYWFAPGSVVAGARRGALTDAAAAYAAGNYAAALSSARQAFFHQELVQTLADGDPALLGTT